MLSGREAGKCGLGTMAQSSQSAMEVMMAKINTFREKMSTVKTTNKFIFITNILLLFVLGIVTSVHWGEVSLFSFPFTRRHTAHPYEHVTEAYRKNTQFGNTELLAMEKDIYEKARCFPVHYDGTLEFRASAVSPTCNCLRNFHLTYIHDMVPNGVIPSTPPSQDKRNQIADDVGKFCFKDVRPTQYDQMHDHNSALGTNLVAGAIVWNILALAYSFFCAWQDVIGTNEMKDEVKNRYVVDHENWAVVNYFWIWLLMIPVLHWPIFLTISSSSVGIIIIMFFTVVGYFVLVWYLSWMQYKDASPGKLVDIHPLLKNILFWVQYSINLSLVLVSANALMQRRDDIYNVMSILVGVSVGLISLANDYVTNIIRRAREGGNESQYKDCQDVIGKFIWIAKAVLLVSLYNISYPVFPDTPFSNAQSVVWFVVPVLFFIPLLQEGWLTEGPKIRGGDKVVAEEINASRSFLDMLPRFIFTVAIMIDLAATSLNDSMPMMHS